jgi:preprotein translocase subunit SecF
MLEKDRQKELKKYQNLRREKVSVFGFSAEFDWFILNVVALCLIVLVFFFSIKELRHTINFEPGADTATQNLLRDNNTIKKIEEIIERFEKPIEESVEEEIEEELLSAEEEESE